MAMNPQSVLSQLRMMSDQQLQQYAAMHKNDPFVFPLAFQESQTRKQMRSEAQTAQAGPQPKVADQALASMMPEDVGIGALPAQNLEGMAAGGIVAFDEGGEVPRYNGQTGSWIDQLPKEAWLRTMAENYRKGRPLLDIQPAAAPLFDVQPPRAATPVAAKPAAAATPMAASAAYTPSVEGMLNTATGTALGLPGALNQAPPSAPPTAAPPAASPPGPSIPPTAFKPAPAPTIASAKELAGQLLDTGAYRGELDTYQKAEQDAVDAAREARKQGKPEGKAYEEYEKTLRDETADLGKQKGEAQGEAWLTAGLAVLGGASPFALQNLGLATKGVEQYRDAMKDIRKATRENAKGLADIAQARRAEERGDWEKTQEFEERASTRMSNARKFGIEGLMNLGVKSAELAGRAYDTQATQAGMDRRTLAELQSREKIAGAQINAQLNAPTGIEKIVQRMQTDPKFAAAYKDYASIGPETRGAYAILQQYTGPKGEMALRMMEAGTPDQKAQAQMIRQQLRTMTMQSSLNPVDVPNALP